MYITDFEYANKRLSDMGYIMCHINAKFGVREVNSGCDITFNTAKNNHSSVHYITSSSYKEVYKTSFEICKNMCGKSNGDMYISEEEVRTLVKWLNRRDYQKFKLINGVNRSMDISYFGSFNVRQIMHGDNIIGLKLIFTSNAPYGFGENIHLEYDITSKNEHFFIAGDGDEIGTFHPDVMIITCKEAGDLKIENIMTGNYVYIANCLQGEKIYMLGKEKWIVGTCEEHSTFYNDCNYEYLDIRIDDDNYSMNEYEVSMPCLITIDYMPIRKIAVY